MSVPARTARPISEIQDDWRFLDENRQSLLAEYPDRFIVIFRGEVMSAHTYAELEQLLRIRDLLGASPVIEFLSTKNLPLRLTAR